jgi:hypothetical protein
MNQNNIYYKKIDLPNYQEIRNRSLEFVKNDEIIFQKKLGAYNGVDLKKFISYCPLLVPSLAELGFEPVQISFIVVYEDHHMPMHIDSFPPYAKLLIPILNTEGSKTNFYGNCRVIKTINPRSGTRSYRPLESDEIQLKDSFELNEPTILRTSNPHAIKVNKSNLPRISLQIETNPDCVKYLNPIINDDIVFVKSI